MASEKKVKFKSKPKKSKILKFLVLMFFFFIASGAGTLYFGYKYYSRDLPDFRDITRYRPKLVSEVYSSDGIMIAEFTAERRKLIDFEEIPPHVVNAFIAVEDRRFYEHEGVDVKSIIAAMLENIQEATWARGASTITQQVIKNILLTPERKLSRKIKEAILAYRIENNLSKQEILYLYLNHIYLADGVYGVEMASQNYFGKSAREINIAEAAILAGLPKVPEYYSPRKHPKRSIERQRLVLRKMHEGGFITQDERLEALETEIVIAARKRINNKYAPYFVEHVRKYLEDKVGTRQFLEGGYTVFTTLDIDLNYEAQWAVKRGIFDIETRRGRKINSKTLKDKNAIQKYRDKQDLQTPEVGKVYPAVVLKIDKISTAEKTPGKTEKGGKDTESAIYKAEFGLGDATGNLTYALSSPWGLAVKGLESPYTKKYIPADGHRGVDVLPYKIGVGDVIYVKVTGEKEGKYSLSVDLAPKTQAALISMDTDGNILAMAGGFDFKTSQFNRATQALRQPGSAFKPIVYSAALAKGYTQTSVVYDMPVIIKDWEPQNYDGNYAGAIVLRHALAKSRNLASVRIMMDIDPQYVVDYSKNFGFTSKLNPYPSLALGGSDVKVLEMLKAFNVFASGGKLVEPRFIIRIYDRDGKLVEDNTGGQFISKEESLKADRESRRLQVLEQLAKKKGRATSDTGYLKEDELSDPNEFFDKNSNQFTFLTSKEFLGLIRDDEIEFGESAKAKQTISPETAYIMADLLQAVVTEGTGRRASNLNSAAPIAGKTGTTNDYTDAWFVGFSPKITTAVWVGRDDHKPLGRKEAGSRAALPIWIDYMEDALEAYPGGVFRKPSNIRLVSTPYGDIPYSVDSLRENVLESLRDNVMIDGAELGGPPMYYPGDYGHVGGAEDEHEIDFILRR